MLFPVNRNLKRDVSIAATASVVDLNASSYNYINFKFHHFRFLSKDDPTVSTSLYLDNLFSEIKNEIADEKSVNKKSLTLAVVKRILENKEAKQQMMVLFEKGQTAANKEQIKQFLDQVNILLNASTEAVQIIQEPMAQPEQNISPQEITQPEEIDQSEPNNQPELIAGNKNHIHFAKVYARTYIIATHIYLEINNNELHYKELIWDIPALKEFIIEKFKAPTIAGTIDDMKGFSYKEILSGKNNSNVQGQLKSQIKQISKNPAIFGADVSAFAEHILKDNSSF